jgi:hypothetical protein
MSGNNKPLHFLSYYFSRSFCFLFFSGAVANFIFVTKTEKTQPCKFELHCVYLAAFGWNLEVCTFYNTAQNVSCIVSRIVLVVV